MSTANIFSGAAGATPFGAAAGAVAQIAATPNTSASGDIKSGSKVFGGINSGVQVPSWVLPAALAFVALVFLLKHRSK